MKKLLLSATALLIAGISFGQAKFGIVAGPQFSSVTSKESGRDKETSKLLTGVRAGITVDLPLADEFYIGTGLLFSGKGGKDKDNSDLKTTISYLQLPVNFLFKPEVGNGNLILGVGPYVAYGIGGKHKFVTNNVKLEAGVFDDDSRLVGAKLKRFDAGAGLVAGYELKSGFNFGLNADLGLINAYDNTDNGRKWKNTSFGVFVGYKFGGR